MPSRKPPLTLIYTPEWKFRELVEYGLWPRERELLCWYAEQFDLDVYSCDGKESAALLADLPLHYRPVPWMIDRFGLRHVCFFLWLLVHTLTHRGVVRGIGIDLPILALVKIVARRPVIVSFQYDWGVIWKTWGSPGVG